MSSKSPHGTTVYVWLISLSLILHVFNDLEIGGLKLFQIPAAIAFIIPLFFVYRLGKVQMYSYLFIIFTFISAFFSPYPEALSKALTLMIVLGACAALPKCKYDQIIKISNCLIPLPLLFLSINLRSNISYRFTGFYNDPNYLCTTLLVFLFLILTGIYTFKNKIIKTVLIFEIITIITITAATLSRTGLTCIALMIVISAWELIKKYKFISIALLTAGIIYICSDTPQAILEVIKQIESREDNAGDFSSASELRFEISMGGVAYVISHPLQIPLGMGIGAVGHWEYFDSEIKDNHIDHNTLTASFSEQGAIGFILYLLILYTTLKTNWRLPSNNRFKALRLGAISTIFIFSLSINQMTYLPFWWLLFLLNNKTDENYENPSYRRFREIR